MRDVVNVLQRTEMVRRIAEEISGDIVQLGVDGRLVKLQLEELMGGVEDERRLVMLDYFTPETGWRLDQAMDAGRDGHRGIARRHGGGSTLQLPGAIVDLDANVQPRGYRLLARIPRLPESVVDRIVAQFGSLQKIMRATVDDLDDVTGVGRRGARHQGGAVPAGRDQHPRPLQLRPVRCARHPACASRCPPARRPRSRPRRRRTAVAGGCPTSGPASPVRRHGGATCRRPGLWVRRRAWPGRDDLPTLADRLRGRICSTTGGCRDAWPRPTPRASSRSACWGSAWAACTRSPRAAAASPGRLVLRDGRVPDMWASPTQGEPLEALAKPGACPVLEIAHGRPVGAGRRPRGARGRGGRGGALRGRGPRLRARSRPAGPPRRRRGRRLAPPSPTWPAEATAASGRGVRAARGR